MESKQEILKAMGGLPEKVYDAIVLVFYEEARGRMAGISQAIAANNFEDIALAAHAIKGSSGNLRLSAIQDAARDLETAAQQKNMVNVLKNQELLTRLIPGK